jgi:Flp pilus assembly protein TadG
MRLKSDRGSSVIEMALVLVPLLFMLLSTLEMARCLWTYHTLAMAIKRGARFSAVHGARAVEAAAVNQKTIADVIQVIRYSGVGLEPGRMRLTFTAGDVSSVCETAVACASNSASWPAAPGNVPGLAITIECRYAFQSVLSFLWPGQTANSFTLLARSREIIQF